MTDDIRTPAPIPDGTPEPAPGETGAEQRLPATGPPDRVSAERFSAAPSIKAIDGLTPQRSAGIVRQSSSARWVGFLTVIFVSLFIVGYWFYELGAPVGISKPRLAEEIDDQQVTAVERGYNLYQANCARCHGPNGLGPDEPDAAAKAAAGQGYIGPHLNAQEKLFAHLSEAYLRNVLLVGGRYVCGNPTSAMPVWSDQGNPPGPLNYRQIEELIAFLRATNEHEYEVRDASINEPIIDPATGEVKTFKGWRDPNYKPDAAATPYPDCYLDALGWRRRLGGAGRLDRPECPGRHRVCARRRSDGRLQPDDARGQGRHGVHPRLRQPGRATVPHNVVIKDPPARTSRSATRLLHGPPSEYAVPALKAGAYTFVCQVHVRR